MTLQIDLSFPHEFACEVVDELPAAGGELHRFHRAPPQLAWDRLHILVADEHKLVGEYVDVRDDSMQRFEVALKSGATRGGIAS